MQHGGLSEIGRSVILGTAGHIDHGKTALVRALTGVDTDRLKEERRRGITIELGFAHMELGQTLVGVVDVPGHERFIKSMVAGAGGIDVVLLVVAADEGVMPQTREHLDICQLLGVQRGCVALTKVDLVDPEWLALVQDDLRQALAGTFLEQAPLVPCSSVTGEGLDPLRQTLEQLTRAVQPRDADGLLRLPLDRVFTLKGFGTVVTGTLLSGTVRAGEEVAVLPTSVTAKVRSVQVHGQDVEQAVAGQRTAVNLGGVDRQEVSRGEVLVHPGALAASPMIDVELQLLRSTRKPLGRRAKVLFHIGTRQQEASCVLLQRPSLEPGERGLAQLRFETPVVALPGDRFILRGFSKQEHYGTTVGGGTVLRVLCPKLLPRHGERVQLLERVQQAQHTGDPLARVELELLAAGPHGLSRAQLRERLPYVPRVLDRQLQQLRSSRRAVQIDSDSGTTVHGDHWQALRQRLLETVAAHHRQHAMEPGISREELRSRLGRYLGPRLFTRLVSELERGGELVVEEEVCRLPAHRVQETTLALRPLAEQVLQALTRAELAPPRDQPLAQTLGAPPEQVKAALRLLVKEGSALRLGELHFATAPVRELQQRLVQQLEREGSISAQQFKELVGQSRKFAIPLAEYFDAQKVTLRVGDVRKLRR